MNEQMSLDEFKKKVRDYLVNTLKRSTEATENFMTENDKFFPMYLKENWEIPALVCGVEMNLI